MNGAGDSNKIVIHLRVLRGSEDSHVSQKVATVYMNRVEYRVYAPPQATGDPVDWQQQMIVAQHSPFGFGGDIAPDVATRIYAIRLVCEELEKKVEPIAPSSAATAGPYYHVRLHLSSVGDIELKLDLTKAELELRILEPYQNLRPIIVGGRTISPDKLERIEIFKTPHPSSQFTPMTVDLARRVPHDCFAGEADLENVTDELIRTPSFAVIPQGTDAVELLCARFHSVAKQLRQRWGNNRTTLDVKDEYDVQDLLHALLRIFFNDVRKEEGTPSFAGKSSRMDFLLPSEKVVIEAKKTRPSLTEKELGTELIDDIARYKTHPSCKKLICFVYDPDGYIANPRGIEKDLSQTGGEMEVKVIITDA
jgi:hypothetical protein